MANDQQTFSLPHIAARIFNTPLMIEGHKLDVIVQVLAPRLGLTLDVEPVALSSQDQRKERKPYRVMNGAAVIPVMDTLVSRGDGLDALSGLTSYPQLSAQFDQALNDGDVSRILLQIDSPGGEAKGLFELTDQIFAARGQKQIVALADGDATSAAYAIGAAAERFYVTQGAHVGSIGVRGKHIDRSQANAANGVTVTDLYIGSNKNHGSPDAPLTDESKSYLLGLMSDQYELFVSKVSQYRTLAPAVVKATEAAIYTGAKAIPLGLVDGVTTLSEILGAEPATIGGSMAEITTIAGLVSAYPELCQELATLNRAEGQRMSTEADCATAVKAEQERVREILSLAGYQTPKLVEQALFTNGGLSADKAARLFLENKQEKTNAAAAAYLADQEEAKPAKVAVNPDPHMSPEQARVNAQLGLSPADFTKFSTVPQH